MQGEIKKEKDLKPSYNPTKGQRPERPPVDKEVFEKMLRLIEEREHLIEQEKDDIQ